MLRFWGDVRGEMLQFGKNWLILRLHKVYHTSSHFLLFWLFFGRGFFLFKNFKSMFNVLYSFYVIFFFFFPSYLN